MRGPERFRRELAARVAKIIGASIAIAGCEGGYGGVVWTGGDTGGSATTIGSGGVTSSVSMSSSSGSGGSDGGTTSVSSSSASSSSASSSAATSGGNVDPHEACFPWVDMGPCPVDLGKALDEFMSQPCPTSGPTTGREPTNVFSGPLAGAPAGQCCYMADLVLCGAAGRPLVLDGLQVLASVAAEDGRDWSRTTRTTRTTRETRGPEVASLSADDRETLATAWASDGLAEHASIASFSRLALELMSFGAPADLIARCHAAALDEVHHATLCFSLASAYAGTSIGPSALHLPSALPLATTLEELAVGTVLEGCLGETIAASLAAEQLAQATDPAVCATLDRIAHDEARHAELAYRIVAWAIAAGGDSVRREVARAFTGAICSTRARETGTEHSASLTMHGRLSSTEVAAASARALRDVILPAVTAPRAATMRACLPTT